MGVEKEDQTDPDAIFECIPTYTGEKGSIGIEEYLISVEKEADKLGLNEFRTELMTIGSIKGRAFKTVVLCRYDRKDFSKLRDSLILAFSNHSIEYRMEKWGTENYDTERDLRYLVEKHLFKFGGKKPTARRNESLLEESVVEKAVCIEESVGEKPVLVEEECGVEKAMLAAESVIERSVSGVKIVGETDMCKENSEDKNGRGDKESEDILVGNVRENDLCLNSDSEESKGETVTEVVEFEEISTEVEIEKNVSTEAKLMSMDIVSGKGVIFELVESTLVEGLLPEVEVKGKLSCWIENNRQVCEKLTEVSMGKDLSSKNGHEKSNLVPRKSNMEYLWEKIFCKRRVNICVIMKDERYSRERFRRCLQNKLGKSGNWKFRRK